MITGLFILRTINSFNFNKNKFAYNVFQLNNIVPQMELPHYQQCIYNDPYEVY